MLREIKLEPRYPGANRSEAVPQMFGVEHRQNMLEEVCALGLAEAGASLL